LAARSLLENLVRTETTLKLLIAVNERDQFEAKVDDLKRTVSALLIELETDVKLKSVDVM